MQHVYRELNARVDALSREVTSLEPWDSFNKAHEGRPFGLRPILLSFLIALNYSCDASSNSNFSRYT